MSLASFTVAQGIQQTYLLATGKATAPDIASTKGQRILGLLNYFQGDWASARQADWHTLRKIFTMPVTVTATDTFGLTSFTNLNHLSRQEGDFLRIYGTDGASEWDYEIVEPQRLYNDGRTLNNGGISTPIAVGTCAVVGTNMVFSTPFLATDPQIGGSIKFPGYIQPNTLAASSDLIQCDDTEWLCTRAAAEYVRNDITRVQLYQSLTALASDKWADMLSNNESQIEKAYTSDFGLLGQTYS